MPNDNQRPLVVGLGGSMREGSLSRAALKDALCIAKALGCCTELLDLRELDLPVFRPGAAIDAYPEGHRPGIGRLLNSTRRADAMIWSSPTYHGTISGALKNALDFLDLLADDRSPYLHGRVVGLLALSDRQTLSSMRSAAYELRAWVAPTQVVLSKNDDFDDQPALREGRTLRGVTHMVAELIDFVERSK